MGYEAQSNFSQKSGSRPGSGSASEAVSTLDGSELTTLLASHVSDGILRVDRTGRIVYANREACFLFGVLEYPPPSGKILGQTLLEATHLRALTELCLAAQNQQVLQEAEVQQVGRAERLLRVRAVPLPSPNKDETLFLLSDRTEMRRLHTLRSEFVANVSHELRTPLASIRATAETLLEGAISDLEYRNRFLQTIIREADRLVRLSEDLLELSRAESSRRQTERFELRSLMFEVAARLLIHAERRGIHLVLPPDTPPIYLDGDRSEIDQVLFNLLDNAIKYTPTGGTVTLKADMREGNRQVALVITDTGIGILSQDLPYIFDRFWRADRARRFQNTMEGAGTTGGTGLGLSIVKHIVEAHGGTVAAESELGEGSRFTVLLPLPDGE